MSYNDGRLVLRPQDVVLLLKKITSSGLMMNGKQLAESLGISTAEVSHSLERCRTARLIDDSKTKVNVLALRDFISVGVKYCFPAQPGADVRGIPTASSSSPIKDVLSSNGREYVWKDPDGTVIGQTIVPLYRNAVFAAKNDPEMHVLLAIVDSFRIGRAREIHAAYAEFEKYLSKYAESQQQ